MQKKLQAIKKLKPLKILTQKKTRTYPSQTDRASAAWAFVGLITP